MASMVNTVSASFSYNPSLLKNHQSSKIASIKVGRARDFSVRAEAINPQIRKEEAKVVDSVEVTELSKPLTAYCVGGQEHFLCVMEVMLSTTRKLVITLVLCS
ncbi:hypothetical protein AQUCO_01300534v1 [Aquilegia coerulea]|uniref:Uncharacterized protein n=1 Tax=Aquilegia coerulea TaxID=218851 RepID=A0A2G5E258_AQUCA|nr:hypothetical protein AQUCO_01300534v1 [Aquilegia coerulea]